MDASQRCNSNSGAGAKECLADCTHFRGTLVKNDDRATLQDLQLGRVGEERIHFSIRKRYAAFRRIGKNGKTSAGSRVGLPVESRRQQRTHAVRGNSIQAVCRLEVKETDSDQNQDEQQKANRRETAATSAACPSTLGGHASVCVVEITPALLTMDDIKCHLCPVGPSMFFIWQPIQNSCSTGTTAFPAFSREEARVLKQEIPDRDPS